MRHEKTCTEGGIILIETINDDRGSGTHGLNMVARGTIALPIGLEVRERSSLTRKRQSGVYLNRDHILIIKW